jgi:hypothetical protein
MLETSIRLLELLLTDWLFDPREPPAKDITAYVARAGSAP